MEQEGSLDFKALRAKFQEEAALRHIRNKPAIPEKPKLIPPPGARVSLLSSINAAVENKNAVIPRVVFKDAKTASEAKRPLSFPVYSKPPVRDSNFNTEVLDHQQKKEGDVVKQAFKDRKLPLVLPVPPVIEKSDPAPPPKSVPPKKKPFLPFKSKFSKASKESTENTGDGPTTTVEGSVNTSRSTIDTNEGSVNISEGPASISERPAEANENSADTSECPISVNEDLPSSSEGAPNTTDSPYNIDEVPVPSTMVAEEIDGTVPKLENGNIPHELGLCSEPQSPSSEMADTPPLGDEKADEESTGSRTPPCDQRVLNALEKAKRKFSPFPSHPQARPNSASPVNGDGSGEMSPSRLCPELPPIDYEDLIGRLPSAASDSPDNKLDGSSLRQSSPSLEGSVQQGMEELIPPPRQFLPDLESLGPSPEKPARPPFVDLDPYLATAPETYEGNALEAPALLDISPPHFDTSESEHVELEVPQLEAPEVPDFEKLHFEDPHLSTNQAAGLEYGEPGAPDLGALNVGALDLGPPESGKLRDLEFGSQETEAPEAGASGTTVPDSPGSPISKESEPQPGLQQEDSHYESCDNVYEDVEAANKFRRGQNARQNKRKGPPKNPYADAQPVSEESHKSSWFFNSRNERKASPEAQDDKEQKKKEKQRLEKEKKEQKEREKKENEMKKKFKITGQEEPMYQAKVILPSKGRKNDLPLKSGDIVSIIRTTNCPKGKWLARDNNNKYGYISVKSVELDIKEMLELGKKAQAAGRSTTIEGETVSTGSRSSNHYPLSACSFTDDSEEWTGDDDDTLSPTDIRNSQTAPEVDMFSNHADVQHIADDGSSEDNNIQARHEALQKLATFFQQPRETAETGLDDNATAGSEEAPSLLYPADESSYLEQEEVMELLPPPELYADSVDDDVPSLPTIGME